MSTSTDPSSAASSTGPSAAADHDPVLQEVPLGTQWPTVDPFLFCAHHLDRYPAGNGRLAPDAVLDGRDIGQDFAGVDGWNMYHGSEVPGFPNHPHRGFETVTYVREGLCDHSDSLGAAARFGEGDAQWITAGRGIVHSEMFPLVHDDRPNTLHLFQIWLNLPAEDKLADPHFAMLWGEDVPKVERVDEAGRTTVATLIAGELDGHAAPAPPPHSWAARPEADVAIWHLRLDPGATFELPAAAGAATGTVRTLYVFEGDRLGIGSHAVASGTGAVVECDRPVALHAGHQEVEVLVLQGRPIGEPVARYGPFVMNTEAEIRQAFTDYQATQFGGWPWDREDPDHGTRGRFARYPDGTEEDRSAPT